MNEPGSSITSPHDAAFKSAFQKIELAEDFFRHYFPEEIADQINFDTLKLVNGTYVDEQFRSRHSDIVYEAEIEGQTALLYILFEHQSTVDYWIIFRLLCYMINIWREYLDQNPEAKKLPVILPAVLYHGKQKWNAPKTFSELIRGGEGMAAFVPEFSYQLYDLSDYEDERLFLSGTMTLGVVFYLMKHIFDADFVEHFRKAAEWLGKISDEATQLECLEWMLRYTYHTRDDQKEAIDQGIEAIGKEKSRRVAMTIAERLRKEGEQRGILIGKQEGRREGIREGEKNHLVKMLKRRFTYIPDFIEHKIRHSEMDLLDKFGDAIFDFQDLKDVERWWETHGTRGNA